MFNCGQCYALFIFFGKVCLILSTPQSDDYFALYLQLKIDAGIKLSLVLSY